VARADEQQRWRSCAARWPVSVWRLCLGVPTRTGLPALWRRGGEAATSLRKVNVWQAAREHAEGRNEE
jgi:hypothetical protein